MVGIVEADKAVWLVLLASAVTSFDGKCAEGGVASWDLSWIDLHLSIHVDVAEGENFLNSQISILFFFFFNRPIEVGEGVEVVLEFCWANESISSHAITNVGKLGSRCIKHVEQNRNVTVPKVTVCIVHVHDVWADFSAVHAPASFKFNLIKESILVIVAGVEIDLPIWERDWGDIVLIRVGDWSHIVVIVVWVAVAVWKGWVAVAATTAFAAHIVGLEGVGVVSSAPAGKVWLSTRISI